MDTNPGSERFIGQIFENMCRGIMKRGLIYGPQTDILTYEGGRSNTRRRRREAGCNTELRKICSFSNSFAC
jgi:hypothetical protein